MNPSPTSTARAVTQPPVDLDLRVESQDRSPRERVLDVISRRHGEILTYQQIADEAGCSKRTVQREVSRLRADVYITCLTAIASGRGRIGFVYLVTTRDEQTDRGGAEDLSTRDEYKDSERVHSAPDVYLPAMSSTVQTGEDASRVSYSSSEEQAEQLIIELEQHWRLPPGGIREPGRSEIRLAILATFDGVKDCVREIDRRQGIDPVAILLTKIRADEHLTAEAAAREAREREQSERREAAARIEEYRRWKQDEQRILAQLERDHDNTKEAITHVP